MSTAAAAFFGFSTGARQAVFHWIAIGSYLLAVTMAVLIFKPVPMKINVAHDTARELFVPPSMTPTQIYYEYACDRQDAILHAGAIMDGKLGIATRFRTLIAAIAVLIVSASLIVVLGSEQPVSPTHVIVEKERPMSDEKSKENSEQPSDQSAAQDTVEIDPRRRVGIGGGVDSFRHEVDDFEEQ